MQHLREELIRIEGDGSEQAIEGGWSRGLTGRGGSGLPFGSGLHDHSVPNGQTDRCQDQSDDGDERELPHVSNRLSYRVSEQVTYRVARRMGARREASQFRSLAAFRARPS